MTASLPPSVFLNETQPPNPNGIGTVPKKSIAQTANIAKTYGVIKKAPSNATTYQYADRALNLLKKAGVDVWGKKYKPITVKVTEGGK